MLCQNVDSLDFLQYQSMVTGRNIFLRFMKHRNLDMVYKKASLCMTELSLYRVAQLVFPVSPRSKYTSIEDCSHLCAEVVMD